MPPAPKPQQDALRDEVVANILAQPVGPYVVGSYGLPREFLGALADRIICASYQDTFRAFPSVDPPSAKPREHPSRNASLITTGFAANSGALASLPEDRPPLRGYRPDTGQPFRLAADADPAVRRAADIIASRLTRLGLIATAAEAIAALPADRRAEPVAVLRDAGLPVDLLEHFSLEGIRGEHILRRLGASAGNPLSFADAARFDFRPTMPGFRATLDDGSEPASGIRLHLTGDTYWGGIGAGSSLEVASQMARAFAGSRIIAGVREDHAGAALKSSGDWAGPDARVELIPQPLPVSQWAQDNAKPGRGPDGAPACLLPRYASRGEDGSILLPGDTLAGENLAAAGITVRRSGLLFQGGNVMCVAHPRTGERVLLIGEAEVHRNTLTGLSPGQVIDAFKAEFAAERAITLPASSFHIDFDVAIIRHAGDSTAFVNDTLAGAMAVVDAALAVLHSRGVVDTNVAAARELLREGRPGEASKALDSLHRTGSTNPGALLGALSTGPQDPGAANLRLLLAALDLLLVHTRGPDTGLDANHRGYLQAVARLERLRSGLRRSLEREGWRTVGIPSFSEQRHGLNFINVVHSQDALFIPAWGGVYGPVDASARGAFQKALPGIRITEIRCAETLRRAGGPHCAAMFLQ